MERKKIGWVGGIFVVAIRIPRLSFFWFLISFFFFLHQGRKNSVPTTQTSLSGSGCGSIVHFCQGKSVVPPGSRPGLLTVTFSIGFSFLARGQKRDTVGDVVGGKHHEGAAL